VRLLRRLRDGLYRWWDRRRRRRLYEDANRSDPDVEFLGLWDTVAAYGLPIDELTRGWDYWIWPLTPADHTLHAKVRRARHALSLNDERQTFFPLLIDETGQAPAASIDQERITQVWFAGVHGNVGGGYPDDSLALTPLVWMATEAEKRGLRFMPHLRQTLRREVPDFWLERSTPCAPSHDSRKGLAAYYRYHPRPVDRLCRPLGDPVLVQTPKIHQSVFERIRDSGDRYAPFNLPQHYQVVMPDGRLLGGGHNAPANPFEDPAQARSRANGQERAWNLVWWRRILYFSTLAVTLTLLFLPYLDVWEQVPVLPWKKPGDVLAVVASFLPSFASGWIERYQRNALVLFGGAALLWLLMRRSSRVDAQIGAVMREVWEGQGFAAGAGNLAIPPPTDWLARLRNSMRYRRALFFFSHTFWPNVFGVSMLVLLLVALPIRAAFLVARSGGMVCQSSAGEELNGAGPWEVSLPPEELCHATGHRLKAGEMYRLEVALPHQCKEDDCGPKDTRPQCVTGAPWFDKQYSVDSADGFSSLRGFVYPVALPARRLLMTRWMAPVAAIGAHFPEQHAIGERTEFRAGRDGPLLLYVNDAVLPWPRWSYFYENNRGAPAKVRITRLPSVGQAPPVEEKYDPFNCATRTRQAAVRSSER
jgi:hypothetical protein